jgi:hypothetical protein
MEDCKICYSKESSRKLPCSHELCSDCCVRLNAALCPFCRAKFIFNGDEIKQRNQLGLINGYNWVTPPSLALSIPREPLLPRDWLNSNRQFISNEDLSINVPFSRAQKNGERRRRRFLSLDEVLERRKELKKRKEKHWEKKNGRLDKINGSWEI